MHSQTLEPDYGFRKTINRIEEILERFYTFIDEIPFFVLHPVVFHGRQGILDRADGTVEFAVLSFLENGPDRSIEIGLGFVVIFSVTEFCGTMNQSYPGEGTDLGADGTFRESCFLDDLIERERRGGEIDHGEDGSHPLGKAPEAADLAQPFCEVLFDLGK